MTSDDTWTSGVTAWKVSISEKARGENWVRGHHATGILKRVSDGVYSGILSSTDYELVTVRVPATKTETSGRCSWAVNLSTVGRRYLLGVAPFPISPNVPQITTALTTGKVHKGTFFVSWDIMGSVEGELPQQPESLKGEAHDEGSATAIWTLTPEGATLPVSRPKPRPSVAPAAHPTPAPPSAPAARPTPAPPSAPNAPPVLRISGVHLEQFAHTRRRLVVEPLALCSVGVQPYFNGMIRFSGIVAFHGMQGDALTAVELQLVRGNTVVRGGLTAAMRKRLLRAFPRTGILSIQRDGRIPPLLFEVRSSDTEGLVTEEDSRVEIRVHAATRRGGTATVTYGSVPILVRVTGGRHYPPPNPQDGGDEWVLPSVKPLIGHYGLDFGDCSKMNGGPFAPHGTHRNGCCVDLYFEGYKTFDTRCAQRLIELLDDPQYGYKVALCYVLPVGRRETVNAFWRTVRAATLADGRPAASVILRMDGHDDHFHWEIDPRRQPPRHPPRRRRTGPNVQPNRPRPGDRDRTNPADPGRRPGGRRHLPVGYARPVTTVWHLAEAPTAVLHFVDVCPALARVRSAGSPMREEAVAPEHADLGELEAHSELPLCGECAAMYRADFLGSQRAGVVTCAHDAAGDALVVYKDRVEYQIGEASGVTIPVEDLQSVSADRILTIETSKLTMTGTEASFTFMCQSVVDRDRIYELIGQLVGAGVEFHRAGSTWRS